MQFWLIPCRYHNKIFSIWDLLWVLWVSGNNGRCENSLTHELAVEEYAASWQTFHFQTKQSERNGLFICMEELVLKSQLHVLSSQLSDASAQLDYEIGLPYFLAWRSHLKVTVQPCLNVALWRWVFCNHLQSPRLAFSFTKFLMLLGLELSLQDLHFSSSQSSLWLEACTQLLALLFQLYRTFLKAL